jgi:transposase
MADWLLACGVDTVALESTGVYWIPVFEVLEQRGLQVWLVDTRQMKYVPERKSDVQDCQWLQKLMSLGLLRAAFRLSAQVCGRWRVSATFFSKSRPAGCSACKKRWCR